MSIVNYSSYNLSLKMSFSGFSSIDQYKAHIKQYMDKDTEKTIETLEKMCDNKLELYVNLYSLKHSDLVNKKLAEIESEIKKDTVIFKDKITNFSKVGKCSKCGENDVTMIPYDCFTHYVCLFCYPTMKKCPQGCF